MKRCKTAIFTILLLFLTGMYGQADEKPDLDLQKEMEKFIKWFSKIVEKPEEQSELTIDPVVAAKRLTNGADMKELQTLLNQIGGDHNFNVGVADGAFGNKTRNGIKRFQEIHNLTVDGIPTYGLLHQVP